ncbi:Uma2 family endonuclease [Saccharothrix syringae]|uniref:Uma2 family endonuclease n=1 Tax=Saccharothrix syringae TaxID=103733 RepID=A0A5Q0GR25_SACSY|nr:Uma2 family endonuclease [Saccharothrix syringae]QFZ16145.1 Uma2 family endonuclease [Saccharothrix syringae]
MKDETTALRQPRLFTVAEYAALGEVEPGYSELWEGRLLVAPTPGPRHALALGELYFRLWHRLPGDLAVLHNTDVDLELAEPDEPGFSRRPDLVVTTREAARGERMLRASEVLVVCEIVSPGSKRTDRVVKRAEYADAGIPHYWIVDLDEPTSLTPCHLAGDFGYQDPGDVTGTFTTGVPFPVTIDLEQLG